ncbi:uncharacterized protein KGF55_000050 [Candida pseudojiufengensis]|uniref:uncharacterized protein n=1 Tax=Candida pseudojiufengensis TaxID=497109 RepID=UPI002225847D|nr:uncharacterized protein KGF55_000050 [Candida pseudojiufengensis]KAI5967818.1 hypothetical protein KGF55_000050 [Candida pseudojiufengensis]
MVELKVNTKKYKLNNGVEIPAIGLGTWRSSPEDAYKATKLALENSYHHIDTASAYGNEEGVGKAIAESKIPREDIFVTTKLWNTDHDKVEEALDESLKKLKLDYVDLYLVHWPVNTDSEDDEPTKHEDYVETWKKLQKIYKEGKKVKAIGVSNFTEKKLQKLLDSEGVDVVPVINQIEAHPLLTQPQLVSYLKSKDIYITAYSPLGSDDSPLFKNETVIKIAEKNKVEPAQVLISWAVQRNSIVIPKSVHEERIKSNLETFTLSNEDFEALNEINEKDGPKRTNDPGFNNYND